MFSRALRGMLRRAPTLTLVLALTLAQAACSGGPASSPDDFELVAQLDVGRNPHQVSFSEDGRTAYVATAGEDRVTVIDAARQFGADRSGLGGSECVGGVALRSRLARCRRWRTASACGKRQQQTGQTSSRHRSAEHHQ